MNGEKRLHMIFLLILILTTILVILLFSDGTTTEAFGNEISNIPSGTYGIGGDQGATSKDTPLSPMNPGAGYYAINVGTIDAPIWKRKAVPYGYQRDPTDFTKLIGRTEAAIQGSTGGLTDADAIAPPYLNIPGAEYQGGSPDYGAGIKPPASGFYKVQIMDGTTTKYYMKRLPNDYVADRKDLLIDNVNPGTAPGSKKYTKLVFRAPEITEETMMITSDTTTTPMTEAAIQSDPAWDGYYIINSGGTYYKKLIPDGYDIDSNDPPQTEYRKLPAAGKHTPLKYNPNFTPEKYSMTDISYNARDTDRVYRDPTAGKTDDPNLGKYWMFDDEGKLIEVNTESNKSPILYYVPGAYKFGASNYVPNYEDSVYLSRTTRESQLAPVINTASQLGGFCTQYAGNTMKIEEKCAAQDLNACASTSCCVLLGGQKCVAGSENGPKNVANYTDYNLMNRDFYYYQGKCYGNCP
jgi:hypothetical protein